MNWFLIFLPAITSSNHRIISLSLIVFKWSCSNTIFSFSASFFYLFAFGFFDLRILYETALSQNSRRELLHRVGLNTWPQYILIWIWYTEFCRKHRDYYTGDLSCQLQLYESEYHLTNDQLETCNHVGSCVACHAGCAFYSNILVNLFVSVIRKYELIFQCLICKSQCHINGSHLRKF